MNIESVLKVVHFENGLTDYIDSCRRRPLLLKKPDYTAFNLSFEQDLYPNLELSNTPLVINHFDSTNPLVVVNGDYFRYQLGEDFSDIIPLELGFASRIAWSCLHIANALDNVETHSEIRKIAAVNTLKEAERMGLFDKYLRFKQMSLKYELESNPIAGDDFSNMLEYAYMNYNARRINSKKVDFN